MGGRRIQTCNRDIQRVILANRRSHRTSVTLAVVASLLKSDCPRSAGTHARPSVEIHISTSKTTTGSCQHSSEASPIRHAKKAAMTTATGTDNIVVTNTESLASSSARRYRVAIT